LEVQILHYYLRIFSIPIFIIFYIIYLLFVREITLQNDYILIEKNSSYNSIIKNNFKDNRINKYIFKFTIRSILLLKNNIHYGKFFILEGSTFYDFIKTIISPSNVPEKITIVEGWSKKQLNEKLAIIFEKYEDLNYDEILADTYFYSKDSTFIDFKKNLKKNFLKIKNKFTNHELLKKFTFNEIIIIGSLLEREGINSLDKKKNLFSYN